MKKSNFEVDKYIVKILKVLGATSKESAVSAEDILNYAIANGMAEAYPRNGFDGHPWFPRLSLMVGVGTPIAVKRHNEPHLFRRKGLGNAHTSMRQVYLYWFDSKNRRKDPAVEYAAKIRKKVAETKSAAPEGPAEPTPTPVKENKENKENKETIEKKKNPTAAPSAKSSNGKVTIEVSVVVEVDSPTDEEIRKVVSDATLSLFDADWAKRHPNKVSKYVKITR